MQVPIGSGQGPSASVGFRGLWSLSLGSRPAFLASRPYFRGLCLCRGVSVVKNMKLILLAGFLLKRHKEGERQCMFFFRGQRPGARQFFGVTLRSVSASWPNTGPGSPARERKQYQAPFRDVFLYASACPEGQDVPIMGREDTRPGFSK